jgi:hypothetical protein
MHDLDSPYVRRLMAVLVHHPHAGGVLGEVDPDGLELARETVATLGALGSGVPADQVETDCVDEQIRLQLWWIRGVRDADAERAVRRKEPNHTPGPVLDRAPADEARRLLAAIALEVSSAAAEAERMVVAGGLDL